MDQNAPPQFETTYEWKIENFSMCPQDIDECLRSNTFYLDSIDLSEYQLILYPRGRLPETTEPTLCLLECLKGSKFPINVTMYIAYEDELKKIETRGGMEKILMNTGGTIVFELLPNKPPEPVIFALLPGELFTVRCTITLIHDPQTDKSQLDNLSRDLEQLLYGREPFSDFYIISLEGHKFPVHKMMLTTRCPGLAKKMGIFDNEICCVVDHKTAEALRVILLYVYTGRLYENVPEDVRNVIHSMVVEYDMDDLKRELFPPEICTGGRTTIQVDTHNFTWNLVDFGKKVKENVWPSETTIDLVIGKFVASFSVVRENYGKTMIAQIDLKCLKLMLDRSLTVKCVVVQATVPLKESSQNLCKGEYKFSPHNLEDIFRLKGEIYTCYLHFLSNQSTKDFEDSLALVFNFSVSYLRDCEVETIKTLDNIRPMWKRSLYRLSSDLDIAFRDTCEDDKGSDMRVRLDGRPVLRATYDYGPNGPFIRFDNEPGDPGPAIPAHRFILSVRSDCLSSMIKCDVRSELDNTCEIRMTCAPLETVKNVLRHVYSGKLSNDIVGRDLVHIYIMSNRYKMRSLAKRCLQLIPLKVDLSDLKLLLHLSNERRDLELYRAVVSIIRNNRDSIQCTPEWDDIMNEIPGLARLALREAIFGLDSTT